MGRTALEFHQITSIIYDEIGDRIYFTDMRTHDNGSIYTLGRQPNSPSLYVTLDNVVAKIHEDELIRGLAFDPLDRCLYWIDETLRRIYRLDVKQPNAEPLVWLQFEHEVPQALSVDVCRRYLYWTTDNDNVTTIERASLAGNKRSVLVSEKLQRPIALEIDQFSNRMFWIDDHAGTQVSVESADLHGGERTLIYEGAGRKFRSLIVDEEHIFVVDYANECVYQLNKTGGSSATVLAHFEKSPRGIIKRPRFIEMHDGHPICRSAVHLLKEQQQVEKEKGGNGSLSTDLENTKNHANVVCLNGKVSEAGRCECSDGWKGASCETKLCHNYCFHGKCAVASTGFPLCHCDVGFTGERCETARCNGYCLNDGRCELEGEDPVCHCLPAFSGRHCEMINSRPVICRAYCEVGMLLPNIDWSIEDECR